MRYWKKLEGRVKIGGRTKDLKGEERQRSGGKIKEHAWKKGEERG